VSSRPAEALSYGVFFVSTAERIDVVACMHARRDPRRWEERVGQ